MKSFSLVAGLLAGAAYAAPVEKRQATNIDTTVLQFALTLEHLENAFYKGALTKFSQNDFVAAGYSADYYNNLQYIALDEQVHVQTLTSALQAAGVAPVAACTYNFPYTDVNSFITISSVLEGVGTSAYLAGAPLITSKAYLTVAGSILVTEAIHTSYQRAAKGEVPMANPFGTPLDPTSVFTLAAGFIVSCPASNMALPFVPFPALTYNSTGCTCEEPDCTPSAAVKRSWESWPATASASASACAPPSPGATITLTASKAVPKGSFVTFINGLSVISVPATISGETVTAAIPAVDAGQTYVLITSSDNEGALNDTTVLFGPAVVEVNPPAAGPQLNFGQI